MTTKTHAEVISEATDTITALSDRIERTEKILTDPLELAKLLLRHLLRRFNPLQAVVFVVTGLLFGALSFFVVELWMLATGGPSVLWFLVIRLFVWN